MPNREFLETNVINWWKGVDQRTQPTLVQDGFFSMTRGTYFGFGENCTRLPGKQLCFQLPLPLLNIFQFENTVLVQTLGILFMMPVSDLTSFTTGLLPLPPAAPTFGTIASTSIQVITPSTLPLYATTFGLQQSTDNATWTTIATGLATLQTVNAVGLTPSTEYYFRILATNGAYSNPGPSASTSTIAADSERLLEDGTDIRVLEDGTDIRILET